MESGVRAALSEAFPDRELIVTDDQLESGQPGNQIVAVRFQDGQRAFLKVATDGNRQRIVRDAAATRYAATQCDTRAPRVLASDPDADLPYVATTLLTGTAVASRWGSIETDERTAILRRVGRGLAGIYTARFDGSGHIVGGDADEIDLNERPWADVLWKEIERRTADDFPDRFSDTLDQVRQSLQEHSSYLNNASNSLLHCDPRPENCFLNRQTGFIDWETALVGDPTLDICYVENMYAERPDVTDTDRLYHALRMGYREQMGELPDEFETGRRIYRVVTFLLLQMGTFDYWAPQADEPTEELAEWVDEEITQRINCLSE